MRDINTKFGNNAGEIWSTLNEKGCLKKKGIIKITDLNEDDFHTGLGWLARENKISRDDKDCFKLETTNMDSEIGTHAGRIWKILDIWGDADFTTIQRLSDLQNKEIHTALGWLAKEEKITLNEKQKFELK